jgi:hypothetical protein
VSGSSSGCSSCGVAGVHLGSAFPSKERLQRFVDERCVRESRRRAAGIGQEVGVHRRAEPCAGHATMMRRTQQREHGQSVCGARPSPRTQVTRSSCPLAECPGSSRARTRTRARERARACTCARVLGARVEERFITATGPFRADDVLRAAMPEPLDAALFVRTFRREVRAPFLPTPLSRALTAPPAALARLRGHDERYASALRSPAARPGDDVAGRPTPTRRAAPWR